MAKQQQPFEEKILIKSMDDVMHESIMPYAEHIILERALPRVEDGLKPVQRRISWTIPPKGSQERLFHQTASPPVSSLIPSPVMRSMKKLLPSSRIM